MSNSLKYNGENENTKQSTQKITWSIIKKIARNEYYVAIVVILGLVFAHGIERGAFSFFHQVFIFLFDLKTIVKNTTKNCT